MSNDYNPAAPGADPSTFHADDRPRTEGGTGLLTPEQAIRLAQVSVDAGENPETVRAALARDGITWNPDPSTPEARAWAQDHETGHGERYSTVGMDRHFTGDDPVEVEALGNVTREFVARLGFDRSAGSDLASEIGSAIAAQRGMRPDARAAYEQQQAAMLGGHRDQLTRDAASALAVVPSELVQFMRQSGALSSANVVMALAHMAQARAARG